MTQQTDVATKKKIEQHKNVLQVTLLGNLTRCGFENILPSIVQLENARSAPLLDEDIQFIPPPKPSNQSDQSYKEQMETIHDSIIQIKRYLDPNASHKNIMIVGDPGVGKTTVAEILQMYCLSKGLNGMSTSLIAEQAKQLGGMHIHQLFAMKASYNGQDNAGRT